MDECSRDSRRAAACARGACVDHSCCWASAVAPACCSLCVGLENLCLPNAPNSDTPAPGPAPCPRTLFFLVPLHGAVPGCVRGSAELAAPQGGQRGGPEGAVRSGAAAEHGFGGWVFRRTIGSREKEEERPAGLGAGGRGEARRGSAWGGGARRCAGGRGIRGQKQRL